MKRRMVVVLLASVAFVAGAREARGQLSPQFVCGHAQSAVAWRPESGMTCAFGVDGDVWQWCRGCERWVMGKAGFDATHPTYVICHGHANSIDEKWIRDMADALPSDSNVLAVNWGDGADKTTPHESAMCIPDAVDRADWSLRAVFGIQVDRTTFIGHSHGAHVAANVIYDLGEGRPVARFVGLDTSTDEFGVHEGNRKFVGWYPFTVSYGPDRWFGAIRSRCRQVEFYKTSWVMSMAREKAYGHYNFVVVKSDGLPEDLFTTERVRESLTNGSEIGRHSYAHEWFTATIRSAEAYPNLGFNFSGDAALADVAGFCGLIRDTELSAPMGCFVVFDGGQSGPKVVYHDYGKVYALPGARTDASQKLAGWRCSNGRHYDDGVLAFSLGQGGGTVTMSAIWE